MSNVQGEIRQLKNTNTGNNVFPYTVSDAIIDSHTGEKLQPTGVPIFTQELILERGTNLPNEYISINSPSDIRQAYTDQIFAAIRVLLQEVLKLKNAFKYGITSYTGTRTAMSDVVGNEDVTETEPLWAIEEDGLNALLDIIGETTLKKSGSSTVEKDEDGVMTVDGTAYWVDDNPLVSIADNFHSKQFLFLLTLGKECNNVLLLLRTAKTADDESATRVGMNDYTLLIKTTDDDLKVSGNLSGNGTGMFTSLSAQRADGYININEKCQLFLVTNVDYNVSFKLGAISLNGNSYFEIVDRYGNTKLLFKINDQYIKIYGPSDNLITTLPVNISNNTLGENYLVNLRFSPTDGTILNITQGSDKKITDYQLDEFFNIGLLNIQLLDNRALVYLNDLKLQFVEDTSGFRVVNLDFKNFLDKVLNISGVDKYNIQVILSRKVTTSGIECGTNFIWMSISNAVTTRVLAEGYWNGTTLTTLKEENPLLDDKFTFYQITFNNLKSDKCKIYSKYEDFSQLVVATRPTDDTYKYLPAHITIRSVADDEELGKLKDYSPDNELVWERTNGVLYIKSDGKFKTIGNSNGSGGTSGGGTTGGGDETMTKEELASKLQELGIISAVDDNWKLNDIGGITLVNSETGNKYNFSVDPYGELQCSQDDETPTLESRITASGVNLNDTTNLVRGFVGRLHFAEQVKELGTLKTTGDIKLYADRLKIGSWYAPEKTTKAYGCSHGFIELENTSDKDINLNGINLYYTYYDSTHTNSKKSDVHNKVIKLPLTGTIKAGSTYLIRCKRYNESNNPNCFIDIKTFDLEWYITNSSGKKELLDLTYEKGKPYGFMLFRGTTCKTPSYDSTKQEWSYGTETTIDEITIPVVSNPGFVVGTSKFDDTTAFPNVYANGYIDSIYYSAIVANGTKGYWTNQKNCWNALSDSGVFYPNAIMKNTFELDPAKQAYQGLNTKDSSRARNANAGDFLIVPLDNEYISFPKTDETYPVNKFTPKASSEGKIVGTDKNDIDKNKPNMVTCSFGLNAHTTKTFNWISGGYFDEYVWIRPKGLLLWGNKFESYNELAYSEQPTGIEEGALVGDEIAWSSTANMVRKEFYFSKRYTNPVPEGSNLHISSWTAIYDKGIYKKIYNRMTGTFPGTSTKYTSHKCVVQILASAPDSVIEYEYVVGRALRSGQPDPLHTSDIKTFKLYPNTSSYHPVIYQTSDQQGFHWMEYQVWGATANEINNRINLDKASDLYIIPVLMNTGDMTQSGCRVNEWVDYYNAGSNLFDHLEQVNVVGNNDLCETLFKLSEDITLTGENTPRKAGTSIAQYLADANNAKGTPCYEVLGTGDDSGKSNPYYFHLFYCYEIDPTNVPIINGKYIPSLYYIDICNTRLIMFNSELTQTYCENWLNLRRTIDGANKGLTINAYTGWTLKGAGTLAAEPIFDNSFTSIYEMVYKMTNVSNKRMIMAMHEMPFTVVTDANLKDYYGKTRSVSTDSTGKESLVGCHANQLTITDSKSTHWLSRLCEYRHIKLVLGGHKHTYACTWPLREYYFYDNDTKNSKTNGPMVMPANLSTDDANFDKSKCTLTINLSSTLVNLSKLPMTNASQMSAIGSGSSTGTYLYPIQYVSAFPSTNVSHTDGVVYFMLQASGFKLFSNKELPSPKLKFARFLPKSDVASSKASNDQRSPMYAIINIPSGTSTTSNIPIKLAKIKNILPSESKILSPIYFGTSAAQVNWLSPGTESAFEIGSDDKAFGTWTTSETILLNV